MSVCSRQRSAAGQHTLGLFGPLGVACHPPCTHARLLITVPTRNAHEMLTCSPSLDVRERMRPMCDLALALTTVKRAHAMRALDGCHSLAPPLASL